MLNDVRDFSDHFRFGGGTNTVQALIDNYRNHDRVIILTDEQAGDGTWSMGGAQNLSDHMPSNRPLYTFNLAGYQVGHAPSGDAMRVTIGGLSDGCFPIIPLLESGRSA